MPSVRYVQPDGSERVVEVPAGSSVMLGAIQNNVRGIDGTCGGCLSCATCHVYVDTASLHFVPPPSQDELDLLTAVAAERCESSRLSCQITMTAELSWLVVHVPERQA